jgi:Holliday junction resolvasome RuvABC endonuclease subunit
VNILALDLGTKTGWALSSAGAITSGTYTLCSAKEIKDAARDRLNRRCDPRFLRLCRFICSIVDKHNPDWIVFEDVEFCKSRMQAHLWASWRAAVWMQGLCGRKIDCLATGKLKHFATGNGGADKDQMARALTLDPRYSLDKVGVYDNLRKVKLDDNAVDALHLLNWAIATFK